MIVHGSSGQSLFNNGNQNSEGEIANIGSWYSSGDEGSSGSGSPIYVYHYLHDALGSVIGLTASNGQLVERYTYDPYGKTLIEHWDPNANEGSGSWIPNLASGGAMSYSAFANPFAWTGQRFDAATGTYHFLARTYSPYLGRWLQRDPIGYLDGLSLYQYLRGSAPNGTDQFGLTDWARFFSGVSDISSGLAGILAGAALIPESGGLSVFIMTMGHFQLFKGGADIIAAFTDEKLPPIPTIPEALFGKTVGSTADTLFDLMMLETGSKHLFRTLLEHVHFTLKFIKWFNEIETDERVGEEHVVEVDVAKKSIRVTITTLAHDPILIDPYWPTKPKVTANQPRSLDECTGSNRDGGEKGRVGANQPKHIWE